MNMNMNMKIYMNMNLNMNTNMNTNTNMMNNNNCMFRGGIPRGGATFRRSGSVDPSSRNGVNGRPPNNQNWQKDCN